jgi:hypothetical protein
MSFVAVNPGAQGVPAAMPDHQPDDRTLNFAGDIDEQGRPLPMTVEVLRARTEKWPVSERAPAGVAALLSRSRQMFVDGYYTYDNFMDAVTRSLQAVEAAFRVRLDAGENMSFDRLIKQATAGGLISGEAQDALHAGRQFRNSQIHATSLPALSPAMAAGMIEASHKMVAELFGTEG